MMIRRVIVFCLSLVILIPAYTQVVYSCDFEDETERQQWQLNVGNQGSSCENKWYIGKPGSHGDTGTYGLYISADNGISATYTANKTMFVVCYRSLTLPVGEYDLYFDWKALGKATGEDAPYICWMPDSIKTNSAANAGGLPLWATTYACDTLNRLSLAASWQLGKMKLTSSGEPYKLVVLWYNTKGSALSPPACIDNIEISKVNDCEEPSELSATAQNATLTLSWKGSAESYDVKVYDYQTDSWQIFTGITATYLNVENLSEGVLDFYVRAHCTETIMSAYVLYTHFNFFMGKRCIDYMDLNSSNCYYGTTANPNVSRGKIDSGYASPLSRHTLHYQPQEYDPRTDNLLKTVPDGELASVRLGNWLVGAEAERIEYNYAVNDESSAVLMLKYAVVMENPGHEGHVQPRFTMEILRANGQPLDENRCGEALFIANDSLLLDDPTWHKALSGVLWKDWTTVGINLKDYNGERLKIRLTTYDCSASGHYGYAYFTLGCSDGQMDGIACGDTPTTQFVAPEGFNYRWYLPENPSDILGTEQKFNVNPSDTLVYNCDVIFPTNNRCYFTLEASALPRYPVASGTYVQSSSGCTNQVTFANLSHVMTVNQITYDSTHTVKTCESAHWDFGDGQTSTEYSPIHVFPKRGGTYQVRLTVGISNDVCQSDTIFTITLPNLETVYDTIPAFGCLGSPYISQSGKMLWTDGFYTDTLTSAYGCDSLVTLDLKFMNEIKVDLYDTICTGEIYEWNDSLLTVSGEYRVQHESIYGCDSISILHLIVLKSIKAEWQYDSLAVCADDFYLNVPYLITDGLCDNYTVTFDTLALINGFENISGSVLSNPLSIPIPNNVHPNQYKLILTLSNRDCGAICLPMVFNVRYPTSILTQRWNDVLALRNASVNGYANDEFVSYQWYKNNDPIQDATASYYYAEGGLDMTAEYYLELTRKADGAVLTSCPVQPVDTLLEPIVIELIKINIQGNQVNVQATASGFARVYNVWGNVMAQYVMATGFNSFYLPTSKGIYLIVVQLDNGQQKQIKAIVR